MKKLLFIAILSSVIAVANAQDNMMNKRGNPILPEAGDWSIGIDAVPFLDWAFDKSRIMSNTGVTSSGNAVAPQMPMTIVGLYMKDANTAYRGRVGINFRSNTVDHIVQANVNNSTGTLPAGTLPTYVTDEVKTSSMGVTIGAGIQKSRGKGRLHGIYGAEAMIGFGNGAGKTDYTYGNSFILTDSSTAVHGQANTFNGGNGGVGTAVNEGYTNSRVTETKSGSSFSFGIDGFIGVEYFCLAKMSISAEYNWGIMISSTASGSTTTESTTSTSTVGPPPVTTWSVRSTSVDTGKSSAFNVGNGDINSASTGSIVFHFYF